MGFRFGSKFNSYLTNMAGPKPKTFLKEDKTTRDLNSIHPSELKSSQRRDSLISSGMQRTSQLKPSDLTEFQAPP